MRRTLTRLVPLTAVALLATACGGTTDPLTVDGDSQAGPAGAWVLVDATPTIEVPDGVRVTLTVEDPDRGVAQVGGTAACNGYGGTVDVTDGGWAPVEGGFAITEMGCEPAIQAAEQAYMDGLARITSWQRPTADALVLVGDGVELRFDALEPVEPAAFEDTVWEVDGFILGSGADGTVSSTMAATTAITVFFGSDGTAMLDTGCALFAGEWTTSGDTIVLPTWGRAADDREPCEPGAQAAADTQEPQLLEVLESTGFTAAIDGQRLTLMNGEVGLSLRSTGQTGPPTTTGS